MEDEEKLGEEEPWQERGVGADLRVLSGVGPHLIVRVLRRHGLKLRKAFAEPGSDRPLHVDGKWLKTFLEATDVKEPQELTSWPRFR